tara:strand:- start:1365 stop:2294 length:930 start_codon:yes stop_codon:yes gene_type:complete
MNGIVVKSTGSWYIVRLENNDILKCRLKGRFRNEIIKSTNPIVVGDKVGVEHFNDSFMISRLFERKNMIVRKSVNLSKQTHIIASNIDQAILIVTLESPITSSNFIDRFLVSASSYDINVVLIFNKTDLYNEKINLKHTEMRKLYTNIGYRCISLSVLHDDLSEIKNIMKENVNILSGHSGVGKSTLLNKLQPNLDIKTKEISSSYHQGQHTTTFSELYTLDFGAYIIDTPGIKGFGLVDIEKNDLDNYFPEFFSLKDKCRFHNCMHLEEPGCIVKESILKNQIAQSRYSSYLDMLSEDTLYRKNDYFQ